MQYAPTISLVGSDTVIGSELRFTNRSWRVISHPIRSLTWDKPKQVEIAIAKGNPNIYILGYSSLDEAESQLVLMVKTIQKAAVRNKAKIICFISSKIFEGCSQEEIVEDLEPRQLSDKARYEYLAETALLKYPNCLSLRFGEYWSENVGYIIKVIRRASLGELILSPDLFSLTSRELLSKVVETAIEKDIVYVYNIVDSNHASSQLVWARLKSRLSFRVEEVVREGRKQTLSNLRWDTVSMTVSEKWESLLDTKIELIIKNALK